MNEPYRSQALRGIEAPSGTFNSLFALACLSVGVAIPVIGLLTLLFPAPMWAVLDTVANAIHYVLTG